MVERTVSTEALLWTAGGRIAAVLAQRLLTDAVAYLQNYLQERIESYYSIRVVQAVAKFDLPTFTSTNVQKQMENRNYGLSYADTTWEVVVTIIQTFSTTIRVASQFGVVFNVLRGHQEAAVLGMLTSAKFILDAVNTFKPDRWVGGTQINDSFACL